jgi:hypothetical protein
MKKLISKYLNKLGYEIRKIPKSKNVLFHSDYNRNINYEFEKEANEAIKIVRK